MPKDQAAHFDLIDARNINGMYFQELEQQVGLTWMPKLANTFTSNQDRETYVGLGLAPQMREWIGGKQAKSFNEMSVAITNKDWESTIRIRNKDRRRDKTGQLQMKMGELASRALSHDAKLLSALIDVGDGTTLATAFDGKALFASDHSVGSSGTIDNAIDYNVTTTTAPTVAEASAAVAAAVGALYSFKDDQGEPLNEFAQEFLIMVPPSLKGVFDTAVRSQFLSIELVNPLFTYAGGGVGGALNYTVVQNSRLTWTDKFAVFRVDGAAKPLIIQHEFPPVLKSLAEGSDNEFLNNEVLFSVEASKNVGLGRFDRAVQVTFT